MHTILTGATAVLLHDAPKLARSLFYVYFEVFLTFLLSSHKKNLKAASVLHPHTPEKKQVTLLLRGPLI